MNEVLERESQLAALRSYALEADSGAGRTVLISGEAGIGKSTLVDQLHDVLPDVVPCLQWWLGACDDLSTPRPLGPLVDIAAQAGGALYRACAEESPREARFEAFLKALHEGAGLRVVVIEDLHWADEATLDMLRFLGRRIRSARVLILATYRDDALAPDEPLRATLGDLASHRSTRRVTLGALSRHAVALLAAGTTIDPTVLYDLTGGSPFFVAEVLAAGSLAVPVSAREVVLARAAGLSPPTRAVLDAASLIGARISPALLSAAGGAGSGQLDELLTSGLLTREGDQLRFRHEIARRAVYEEIAPHHAVDLHRRILAALLAEGCTDAGRLAFHADGAGDSAAVLEHAPRAARQASAVASHREAAAHLGRAVRHADDTDREERATLYDAFADELAVVERWDGAADARRTAIALWQEVGDPLREGASETCLSNVMWRLCRGADSVAAARRARMLLEPLGPTTQLCDLYLGGADATDSEEMARYIGLGADMAREFGVPDLLGRALNSLASVAAGAGEDYETPLLEALQISLTHDLPQRAGQSYANLTEYYQSTLRLPETEPFFREALAYCDEHDVATYGNCVRGHYAMALADHGRWDDALHHARDVLASNASPINRLSSLATAGVVYARRGDVRWGELLAEAEEVASGVDEPVYLAWAGLPFVEAAWLAGDHDAARARLHLLRERLTTAETTWLAAVIAWEHRLGVGGDGVPSLAPYAAQVAGTPRHAAELWARLQMPYHAALALGDSSDGDDLRQAVSQLEPLSPPAARVIRRRMRDLGLRAVPTGPRITTRSDPQGLTRREREVLSLLCENLTNDEIAARLVISVRTVDHHVSSVLAKLGASSRRQVSALVAD